MGLLLGRKGLQAVILLAFLSMRVHIPLSGGTMWNSLTSRFQILVTNRLEREITIETKGVIDHVWPGCDSNVEFIRCDICSDQSELQS
jgi:hypothetical protein